MREPIAPSLELVVPESEGGIYGAPIAADRDSGGRTWVVVSEQLPMLFSETGEFLGRVGSLGEGPSEFRAVSEVVHAAHDSVAFVDVGNSRVSVWSSTSAMHRAISVPFPFGSIVVEKWPNRVWVSGRRTMRGPTHLIYRLDLSGTQAIVSDSLPLRLDSTGSFAGFMAAQRELALTGDTLWVMTPHAGRIQGWRLGEMDSSVDFTLPWLGDPLAQQGSQGPPQLVSNLDAFRFDPGRREFTIFGRIGDQDRYAAVVQGFVDRGAVEVAASEFPSPAELYWSHRAQVDPGGRVVSDVRLDGLVIDITQDGYAVRLVPSRLGLIRVFLDGVD